MAYRSRIEIQAEILETAALQVSKTRIMYSAALSYFQLSAHLRELIETGLLAYDESIRRYMTTARGHDFLKSFRQLILLVRS
jgi:predicted transcriptional regulator